MTVPGGRERPSAPFSVENDSVSLDGMRMDFSDRFGYDGIQRERETRQSYGSTGRAKVFSISSFFLIDNGGKKV